MLTIIDQLFEEALYHVILGMFTFYLEPIKSVSDSIDSVRNTIKADVSRIEALPGDD